MDFECVVVLVRGLPMGTVVLLWPDSKLCRIQQGNRILVWLVWINFQRTFAPLRPFQGCSVSGRIGRPSGTFQNFELLAGLVQFVAGFPNIVGRRRCNPGCFCGGPGGDGRFIGLENMDFSEGSTPGCACGLSAPGSSMSIGRMLRIADSGSGPGVPVSA